MKERGELSLSYIFLVGEIRWMVVFFVELGKDGGKLDWGRVVDLRVVLIMLFLRYLSEDVK